MKYMRQEKYLSQKWYNCGGGDCSDPFNTYLNGGVIDPGKNVGQCCNVG